MRVTSVHQLIFVIFTALSYISLVDTVPLDVSSFPVNVEVRRPPPRRVPGCPTSRFAHRLSGYFLRTIYDPTIPKEFAEFGGYQGWTDNWFWENFTILDTTPNYPAEQKGKKRPPPGKWAKSRRQFADILNKRVPEIRKVLGDIKPDDNEVNFGGMDDKDCLSAFWKATYTAKLKKPYG
jgi:hypothetical protein